MNKVPARAVLLLATLLGFGLFRANAGMAPVDIRWNELAALIVGHHVSIPVAGGGVVEGQALSVRDDGIMLDIVKTSDANLYAKGQTTIRRSTVTEVRLVERRGTGGRVLGTVVGALLGIVVGAEIAGHGTNSEAAGVSTFSAVAVACTVGGHYAGKRADSHTRLLRIAPSPAESAALPVPAADAR